VTADNYTHTREIQRGNFREIQFGKLLSGPMLPDAYRRAMWIAFQGQRVSRLTLAHWQPSWPATRRGASPHYRKGSEGTIEGGTRPAPGDSFPHPRATLLRDLPVGGEAQPFPVIDPNPPGLHPRLPRRETSPPCPTASHRQEG